MELECLCRKMKLFHPDHSPGVLEDLRSGRQLWYTAPVGRMGIDLKAFSA
jgi:hypothetical protein